MKIGPIVSESLLTNYQFTLRNISEERRSDTRSTMRSSLHHSALPSTTHVEVISHTSASSVLSGVELVEDIFALELTQHRHKQGTKFNVDSSVIYN